MDVISSWVKDIFIVIVALYFVEIILPEGSMRKYIKFIFSVMILGVVISPVTYLSDFDASDIELFPEEAVSVESSYIQSSEELAQVQEIQLIEIYRSKIESEIRGILESEIPDVEFGEVEVILSESGSQKEFGRVHKIVINDAQDEYVSSIKKYISKGLEIDEGKIEVNIQE